MLDTRAGITGIIVCDDDSSFRDIMRSRLVDTGQTVFVAASGLEAVGLAARMRPALILLDIMMPGTNGLEACRLMRTAPNTAITPIVVLTGVRAQDSEAAAFRAGATIYLTKPIAITKLLGIVKSLLPERPGAAAHFADLDDGRKILGLMRQ